LKIIRDKHVNVTINVKSLSMRSLITRERAACGDGQLTVRRLVLSIS